MAPTVHGAPDRDANDSRRGTVGPGAQQRAAVAADDVTVVRCAKQAWQPVGGASGGQRTRANSG